MRNFIGDVAIAALGIAYWLAVDAVTGVREPWDGAGYLACWYPLSILLLAFLGLMVTGSRWRCGLLITFAQLPVMLLQSGVGPLIGVGVLFLAVLAVQPMLVSAIAGWARGRLAG